MNFHDARAKLVRVYPFAELREDALARCPPPDRARHRPGRPRRADRRDRAPSSSPCSSARSMPAPGRCRCRCRPRSAARTPISTSSRVQLNSADPALLLYPPELPMAGDRRRGSRRRGAGLGRASCRRGAAPAPLDAPEAPTTSPICNIRAARPASRTASPSPTARCWPTSPPTPIP